MALQVCAYLSSITDFQEAGASIKHYTRYLETQHIFMMPDLPIGASAILREVRTQIS